jgi:hypothetical protein
MSDTVTTPPVTTQPDPPRHSRRFRIMRAAGISFAGLVVVSAIGGALEGPQAEPAANPAPAVSTSAPAPRPAVTVTARPKPAVTVTAKPRPAVTVTATAPAAPATPAVSAMTTWCTGTGWTDLQTVESDNTTMGDDAGTGDASAVEADGQQLEADAFTAAADLPPLTSAQRFNYGLGMAWMGIAGKDAAADDITGATAALNKASGFFSTDAGVLSCS